MKWTDAVREYVNGAGDEATLEGAKAHVVARLSADHGFKPHTVRSRTASAWYRVMTEIREAKDSAPVLSGRGRGRGRGRR